MCSLIADFLRIYVEWSVGEDSHAILGLVGIELNHVTFLFENNSSLNDQHLNGLDDIV